MIASRVHAIVAAGLENPELLARWKREPESLRAYGVDPAAFDLDAIWKFAGLTAKVKHNGLRFDLPLTFRRIREAMRGDALLIGAVSGGDTLPQLRSAMRTADSIAGIAAPHAHPRIEASASPWQSAQDLPALPAFALQIDSPSSTDSMAGLAVSSSCIALLSALMSS